MSVVECDVPSGSALSRELIERAYFRDSYRAPLSRTELGIVDIFFGIFAHHPLWMKLLLIVRNKVASLAGLDAPTASEILHVEMKNRYAVGEKIGVWPIFSLSDDEIVAGRNNKHMDFRLSVLKMPGADGTSVVDALPSQRIFGPTPSGGGSRQLHLLAPWWGLDFDLFCTIIV